MERPILMTTESVKAILDGRKTMTRRVVTPGTSEVGEGKVDWSKFCWDGSRIYQDTCTHGHTEKHKAQLPFVDGMASKNYPYEHQYLHVPWNWEEDMTIFRIYPRWEVGDRLWVRETWKVESFMDGEPLLFSYKDGQTMEENTNLSDTPDYESWYERVCIQSTEEASQAFTRGLVQREEGGCYLWDTGKSPCRWRPSIFMPRWASRLTLEITGVRVERLQEISAFDCGEEGVQRTGDIIVTGKDMKKRFQLLWNAINGKKYPWSLNPWVWVIKFDNIGVRVK